MRGMKLIGQIAILYIFYRVGMFLEQFLSLPIPGSIIGMLLLFILLLTGLVKDRYLNDGAGYLLLFMPLFFVPATVGVMDHLPFLSSGVGLFLLLALLVSTLFIMIGSGLVGQKAVIYVDNKTREKRGEYKSE